MRGIAVSLVLLLAACSSSKLPAPTGVQASQGVYADQIDISWNAVDGADTYAIYRFENQAGAFEQIGYLDAQYTATYNSVDSPADYPIVPGEHYYYKVAAVDADGVEGAYSDRAEGWALALPAPTGLIASQGDYTDNIDLSWNPAEGAASYLIYRADSVDGEYSAIGFVEAEFTATYNSVDSPPEYPIVPGRHYFYRVSSRNADLVESTLSQATEGWAESLIPNDFAVHLWWSKGSGMPYPGVLTNYTVDIGPDLQGVLSLHYYETEDRTETFAVTAQEYEDLYMLMQEHDMFRVDWSENPRPPTGGATESLSLTADGGSFGPPTFPGTSEEIADKGTAMEAVRALVPETFWD